MKNLYEVLKQKERQLQQLKIEVEALRMVAPLLSDSGDSSSDGSLRGSSAEDRGRAAEAGLGESPSRQFP